MVRAGTYISLLMKILLLKWLVQHSMVVLPKEHRAIQDQQKFTKRHGKIVISGSRCSCVSMLGFY